jgi:hypothetical protein
LTPKAGAAYNTLDECPDCGGGRDEPEMEICELGNYNIVISTGRLGRAECAGPICWILGGEMLDE